MSIKSLNQKGFAAMEAVLVVVILAIIGGTGYYVYQANNKATDTQNTAQTNANTAAPHKKKTAKKSSTNGSSTQQSKNSAIEAAVKSYWTKQGKQVDSVTVTDIEGVNAKGLFHLVGDSGGATYIAHNNDGTWQVISTGQQKPGKAIGTKYDLPTSWYSTAY